MNCRRVRKSLLEYSEGLLPPDRRQKVLAHLKECPDCAALLAKLRLSDGALAALDSPRMSPEAEQRTLAAIRSARRESTRKPGFFHSPRALAVTASVAAVVVAIGVVVGVSVWPGGTDVTETQLSYSDETGYVEDAPEPDPEYDTLKDMAESWSEEDRPALPGETPEPEVEASDTDYDESSLRQTFEELPIRKEFASAYTMGDIIYHQADYVREAAQRFDDLGQDGELFEEMVDYLSKSERMLLLYYLEKARFNGRDVWIIGFAAPPRTGDSTSLTRSEVWVMDPVKFAEDPDSSIVHFLEQK